MIQDQCSACASSQSIPHLPFLTISAGKPNSCAGHGTSSDWRPWCIYTGLSSWGTFWGNGVWNWRIKSEVTIISLTLVWVRTEKQQVPGQVIAKTIAPRSYIIETATGRNVETGTT